MALLAPDPYPLPRVDYTLPPEVEQEDYKVLKALRDASDRLDPAGRITGAVLRWQRADGYAWYVVTGEDPLTLQHIPFRDAWEVEPALIRGLDRDDVEDMLNKRQGFMRVFNQRSINDND